MTARSHRSGHPVVFDGEHWRFKDTGEVATAERPCAACRFTPEQIAPGVCVDACIAPIVQGLNAWGVETTSSCCGHRIEPGFIMLADGREVTITWPHDLPEEQNS